MPNKDLMTIAPNAARGLNDKFYEKRKAAALEIERIVRDLHKQNEHQQVIQLIRQIIHDYVLSHINPNSCRGGVIALAAIVTGIGKEANQYMKDVIPVILRCFDDSDKETRFFACEAMYNIAKVIRDDILMYLNDVFKGLSKLIGDASVRTGAQLLDRLMKDIVTEKSTPVNVVTFIPLLRDRIYTKNPYARQFVVSWISVLQSIPKFDLLAYLPEFLDGLFIILGDSGDELRKMCATILGEFLKEISQRSFSGVAATVKYSDLVHVLMAHCISSDDVTQLTAIVWLQEFVNIDGLSMLAHCADILVAILPLLAYEDSGINQNILLYFFNTVDTVVRLITSVLVNVTILNEFFDIILDLHIFLTASRIRAAAIDINNNLMELVQQRYKRKEKSAGNVDVTATAVVSLPLPDGFLHANTVLNVLIRMLSNVAIRTKLASLEWIYLLSINLEDEMADRMDSLRLVLMETLKDKSDEVVFLNLKVLAKLSTPSKHSQDENTEEASGDLETSRSLFKNLKDKKDDYFMKFIAELTNEFQHDEQFIKDRGSVIIRQLCSLLNAEDVYMAFARTLLDADNTKFTVLMVRMLNTILMTAHELCSLRQKLNALRDEESYNLFRCLYYSWCHNPVATVSLCFLTQTYKHAFDLIEMFGNFDINVEFLAEIDRLVQLLESPGFTYLRLQLLEIEDNYYLVKALYGLLMLLPQVTAFTTLRQRLECVPVLQSSLRYQSREERKTKTITRESLPETDFKDLLNHFDRVHKMYKISSTS
ncbi:Protein VAC14-like protein [Trichoplax sp. H2]|nr:Protein VAC14-like protein [Trichoplax sp. H2]|eukprot:RDD46982.1 Protein VAC14-like protein [Trichoplax sp. H2]